MRWVKLCSSLSVHWHCLSLGLEWKLTFSQWKPSCSQILISHYGLWFNISSKQINVNKKWTNITKKILGKYAVSVRITEVWQMLYDTFCYKLVICNKRWQSPWFCKALFTPFIWFMTKREISLVVQWLRICLPMQGKIPHAVELLSPCATATETCTP